MKSKYDTQFSLLGKTRTLLEGRSLIEVQGLTGVPYFWLREVVAGRIKNPSVNRIQYLYEQLSGKELDV